jgi:2-C-methyl-D-erythritol 2,4-cyclodiphosphate synthase
MRVGIGYDAHPLVEGRKLVLGGEEINFPKGLQGHSDADLLCHSIADALLGASGLGDLGKHFPDDDPKYEGISSLEILQAVAKMVAENGFSISYIDSMIIAQKPKLSKYIEKMRENLASSVGIEKGRVSVKATTTNGLGFSGREEGMEAMAVVLLAEIHRNF